jgi:hypothetical protein
MHKTLLATAVTVLATPALADEIEIKPLVDARLRYEHVDQADKPNDANAVTVRVRAGFEAQLPAKFVLLAGATGTFAVVDTYFDGTPKSARPTGTYPTITDPPTIGLNRLHLAYKGLKGTTITVGRQRINLDDLRFVGGGAGWRQNEQTFDAVRLETEPLKGLKGDFTYAWRVNTSVGIDGPINNPGHIASNNIFANVAYKMPLGMLSGFAYLINQDNPFRVQLSSKTIGGRLLGKHVFTKQTSLSYALSIAQQSDVKRNPNHYSAHYLYGDVAVLSHGWTLGGGYEVLGSDSGAINKLSRFATVTAIQFPVATLHRWNGWADKFTTTPVNGLHDANASIGYTSTKVKPFKSLGATVVYHDYRSDIAHQHYGTEINAQILAKLKRYTFMLKYADYNAKSFATDTRKFWASVEWAI